VNDSMRECRSVAQQAVTALLVNDRETTGDLLEEFARTAGSDSVYMLPFVLAELCAYSFNHAADTAGVDRMALWQQAILRAEAHPSNG